MHTTLVDPITEWADHLDQVGTTTSKLKFQTGRVNHFAETVCHPDQATVADVERWLDRHTGTKSSRSTYRAALKSYYRRQIGVGRRTDNPAERQTGKPQAPSVVEWVGRCRQLELSDATITTWAGVLARFQADTGTDPIDASCGQIDGFINRPNLAPGSRKTYLNAFRAFYRYHTTRGDLAADPSELVEIPRVPQGQPRPVATSALNIAVAAADDRLACWLTLAAYAGLRRSEIALLRSEQIDASWIDIVGKGANRRQVPTHPIIWDAIQRHQPPTGRFWDINPKTVTDLTRQHFERLGHPGVTPHRLRHWFGTEAYRVTKDLRLCQTLLGHANIQTTITYCGVNLDAAPSAIAKLGEP